MVRKLFGMLALVCLPAWSAPSVDTLNQELSGLRARAAKEQWTFKVGMSPLFSRRLQDVTGLKRDSSWEIKAQFIKPQSTVLPSAWDWRDKGVVTPIRDQGSCGSCWAFGTDAAFESEIAIATGKLVNLAEQQLVSCDSDFAGCGGGDFAFGLYTNTGANHSSDYPYTGRNSRCQAGLPEHEQVTDWAYVGEQGRTPTTDEIKQAIYVQGPVAVDMAASRAVMAYQGGIYNACNSNRINHIVALVGWNDADGGYWIMKNSWGTGWGEQGYMRIAYSGRNGRKCNAIGSSAAYGIYKPGT